MGFGARFAGWEVAHALLPGPSTWRGLGVKRDRYEQPSVGEYWFVDLDADQLLVHRRDASYAVVTALGRGDVVTLVAADGFRLAVARILDA